MDKNKEQTTMIETAVVPAKKPRKRRSRSYAVTNEELLYKLADAGLLCMVRGLTNTEPRTWYFAKNPEVKKVIDQFNAGTGTT